jgi:hypothetical protein
MTATVKKTFGFPNDENCNNLNGILSRKQGVPKTVRPMTANVKST